MLPCLGPCAPCLLLSPQTPISRFSDIPLSLFPLLYLHHLVHARSPLSTYILTPVKQSPFSICAILVSLSLIPRVPRPLEGLHFSPRKLYASSPVHCSRRTSVSLLRGLRNQISSSTHSGVVRGHVELQTLGSITNGDEKSVRLKSH